MTKETFQVTHVSASTPGINQDLARQVVLSMLGVQWDYMPGNISNLVDVDKILNQIGECNPIGFEATPTEQRGMAPWADIYVTPLDKGLEVRVESQRELNLEDIAQRFRQYPTQPKSNIIK
jgi:hypothetical protein